MIETGLKYATYLFLFYVLTGIRKGGDLRLYIPYITALFLLAQLAVNRDFSFMRTVPFYALAAYVGISYALVFFSFAPKISLIGLSREVLPGLFLYVAAHFQSDAEEKVKGLLMLFVVALLSVVGGGYFTYGMRHKQGVTSKQLFPDIAFLKFDLYFNVFAMKVNFLLPFAVACTAMLRTKAARYILWALIGASAGAVVLSLSRGGWISLLALSLFFSFFLSRGRLKLSHAIAVSSLFVVIFCAVVWLVFPTVRHRMLSTTLEQLRTITYRTEIWQNFISGVKESPVFGWGYGDRIIWHEGPVLSGKPGEDMIPDRLKIGTHNTFLFVLFHQGIVGLVFYLLFIATGFVRLVRSLMKKAVPVTSLLVFSLLAAFVCVYLLHSTIETLPFAFPCIIFGMVSGMQQKMARLQAAECPR